MLWQAAFRQRQACGPVAMKKDIHPEYYEEAKVNPWGFYGFMSRDVMYNKGLSVSVVCVCCLLLVCVSGGGGGGILEGDRIGVWLL
jgi:hypothetical protein